MAASAVPSPSPLQPRAVLVCGLGRLGQHCLAALKAFGVPLRGIDIQMRDHWHVAGLPGDLESLTLGDCRLPQTLEKAHVESCRTVLIMTGSERANVAAAMTVRSLNPLVRIVIRSGQRNLNRFLSHHLGDFVALEPTLLSAPAVALAALGGETLGLFRLEGELVHVRRRVPIEAPAEERPLLALASARRRVLSCKPRDAEKGRDFYTWASGETVAHGDVVTFIEMGEEPATVGEEREGRPATDTSAPSTLVEGRRSWRQRVAQRWSNAPQMARVSLAAAGLLFALYVACALLYRFQYRDLGVQDALNIAMVLILGGFDNLFGQQHMPFAIPIWLHAFSVLVSVSGTVAIGILYAFLTERVLSVRFQMLLRRHRLPKADHVVLVGLGPLGIEVAAFLEREKRPLIAIGAAHEAGVPAHVPIVIGSLEEALKKAHAHSARSVVALGDDDVANLEAALTARAMNAQAALVIRADDARFRENVAQLVRGARALGVQALAADAFAAAAFGENILQLLHVDDRTLLVTEYRVEASDTLHDKLVAEVAYGFGALPLMLARAGGRRPEFFPSDDLRLRVGDRLVVIASVDGLRDIEAGAMRSATFCLHVDAAASDAAAFEGALAIAKVSGCDVALAQETMRSLPSSLATRMYAPQADRLVRSLAKSRVSARVIGCQD